MVVLSCVVIVLGVGDHPARRREGAADLGAQERVRGQRQPRAEDAPGARPHVRRDAPVGPRRERGEAAGVPGHHRERERAALVAHRERARLRAGRARPAGLRASPRATWARRCRRRSTSTGTGPSARGSSLVAEIEPDLPARADRRARHPARRHQPHRQRAQVRARHGHRHRARQPRERRHRRARGRPGPGRARRGARADLRALRAGLDAAPGDASAATRPVRGSGIGLALVKHIAESHGGRAWVEGDGTSPSGPAGASFAISIPVG